MYVSDIIEAAYNQNSTSIPAIPNHTYRHYFAMCWWYVILYAYVPLAIARFVFAFLFFSNLFLYSFVSFFLLSNENLYANCERKKDKKDPISFARIRNINNILFEIWNYRHLYQSKICRIMICSLIEIIFEKKKKTKSQKCVHLKWVIFHYLANHYWIWLNCDLFVVVYFVLICRVSLLTKSISIHMYNVHWERQQLSGEFVQRRNDIFAI